MRHIAHIAGITAIALFVYFVLLVSLEGQYFLYERVVPPANVTLEEWLESFKFWGTVGLVSSFLASLAWYALAQWLFRVNRWRSSSKRSVWFLFFFLPVIAVVLGILFTRQAQEGAIFAYLFYTLNWIVCYYFATALCSPSSFKYTPPGAGAMRRGW